MTEELKTLKDLKNKEDKIDWVILFDGKKINEDKKLMGIYCAGYIANKSIFSDELKQEAIKWIKELEKTLPNDDLHYSWLAFQKFFNITEEDLK